METYYLAVIRLTQIMNRVKISALKRKHVNTLEFGIRLVILIIAEYGTLVRYVKRRVITTMSISYLTVMHNY